MENLKIIETLQIYSEDFIAYKLDGQFANAVTEAVSLLISQGEQIADLQNELRKAREAQRWIPVSERLPDKMMQCVCRYVFGENTDYPFWQVLWYFANLEKPHFQHDGSMGLTVTHWMPLTEPPKEVSHDE